MSALVALGLSASMHAWMAAGQETEAGSAFAKGNLHAWAFEEYDAVPRTPSERADLLRRLGFRRAGYVGRHVERMKEFDAYVKAYQDREIELIGVWTPINSEEPLQEPHIRMFLESLGRHKITPQWWVTLEKWERVPEEERIDRAVSTLQPVVAEAVKYGVRVGIYGHGRDAWFTQPENLVAIAERFRSNNGENSLGIVYNFHHAHSHVDRFPQLFPKMQPYLIAINLNGIRTKGPMILPLGEGDHEQNMISIIHRSSYRGPVGVLHHQRDHDPAVVLRRNLQGLREILVTIGDTAGASTY